MVDYNNSAVQRIYYHFETTNKSFRDMYLFLKDKGITNNAFFLALLDPDLAAINPRDPKLNEFMKRKILRECLSNYWYFLREIVIIPQEGAAADSGSRYQLHRGNLAMNFCIVHNMNIFAELPRQFGKTIGIICRVLYEYQFAATSSEMVFVNKKFDDSKLNLRRLKDIRDALPKYLRMTEGFAPDGKKIKNKENVESLEHPMNGNRIKTLASARNKVNANSLGRGLTIPRIWYDEFAFIPYNKIIYLAAVPAFKTASMNAKNNRSPHGIIITTTPGDMTTEMGNDAYIMKENATKFDESWYDMPKEQLMELLSKNKDSSFVYIRYTYQQLGRDEEWFKSIVIDMQKDWAAIRREVLLEWAAASDNSPFRKEDLDIVKSLVKQPIRSIILNRFYKFDIYEEMNLKYPPLVGVDVSGGYRRDASAITIVDSRTTRVVADFNCNYINTIDLASVIHELVTKYMPNAVVNIERNGGYGASVLAKLVSTSIKKNLFFEIKDKVVEERFGGGNTISKKIQKTKVYGLDSTKVVRETLIDILRQRMEHHKDKFISPNIFNELQTLEVKKNGRVEHTSNGHDDQIFSYLMALYIWYEGRDVMERWGIQKSSIKTDEDAEEAIIKLEDKYDDVMPELEMNEGTSDEIKQQLEYLNSSKSVAYETWMQQEEAKDRQAMNDILMSKVGRQAYIDKFHVDPQTLNDNSMYTIPNDIYTNFNEDEQDVG